MPRARTFLQKAIEQLSPLTHSADPDARRSAHLGIVLCAVPLNDVTTSQTHLNWLLQGGWDRSLPTELAAVDAIGRRAAECGLETEHRLAEDLAKRVRLTIAMLEPSPVPGRPVRVAAEPPAPAPHRDLASSTPRAPMPVPVQVALVAAPQAGGPSARRRRFWRR